MQQDPMNKFMQSEHHVFFRKPINNGTLPAASAKLPTHLDPQASVTQFSEEIEKILKAPTLTYQTPPLLTDAEKDEIFNFGLDNLLN